MADSFYSRFDRVSHTLKAFNIRADDLRRKEGDAAFMQFCLTGEYKGTDSRPLQAFIDVSQTTNPADDDLRITRDFDSVFGLTEDFYCTQPIDVWAVPHCSYAIKSNIHLEREIMYEGVGHN